MCAEGDTKFILKGDGIVGELQIIICSCGKDDVF